MTTKKLSAHGEAVLDIEAAVIDHQRKSGGSGGQAPLDHPAVWLRQPNGQEHHAVIGSGIWENLVKNGAEEIPTPPTPERVVVEIPAPLPQRIEVYAGSAEHRSLLHQAAAAEAANEAEARVRVEQGRPA